MDHKDKWKRLKRKYNNQKIEVEENVEKQEPIEMTEEEKQRVKKELMGLIWLILIIIIGIIVFFVISGLIKKDEKPTNNEPVVEEKLLEPLEEGEIDVSNEIIQEIDKMFSFNINNPLYEENILNLFNTEKVKIEDLNFQTKMFLITSNSIFNNYMLEKTNLKDYKTKEVSLTKEKLEDLSKEIFGRDINLDHNNFKYYYETKEKVTYFNVTLENDKYIFTETTGSPSSFRVHMNLYYAYKVSVELTLRYQVLFINNNGIYKDKEMTNLISTDRYNVNNYLNKADMYDFEYEESDIYNYFLNSTNPSVYLVNKEGN